MAINMSAVGTSSAPMQRSWTSKDALLYAVAVGAGLGDPLQELEFTTENSAVDQRVLPSFICVAAGAPIPPELGLDMTRLLHAEMGFELFADLAPEGAITIVSSVTGVYDKGSGALAVFTVDVNDSSTGRPVARLVSSMFVRGEGGFGGDRGPSEKWTLPDRAPDASITYQTRPEQALLYRLTGDHNPLHSNPEFAKRAGFDAPILHGMATYGFAARALLHGVAGSDPARFGGMWARFSKTVALGETLTTQLWRGDDGAQFVTRNAAGEIVLDRGRMTLR